MITKRAIQEINLMSFTLDQNLQMNIQHILKGLFDMLEGKPINCWKRQILGKSYFEFNKNLLIHDVYSIYLIIY